MAKTRQIRKRIISVRNINKITRTMERVAQSKAMKLTGRFDGATSYRGHLARLLPEALGVAPGTDDAAQALSTVVWGARRTPVKRVLIFSVTSSRGLCGGYNARVIHATQARIKELTREGKEASLAVLGRKGLAYFRFHNQPVTLAVPDTDENIPFQKIDEVVQEIIDRFVSAEFDAVEIMSTHYKTKLLHEVRATPLLPMTNEVLAAASLLTPGAQAAGPATGPGGEPLYLVEPDRGRVLAVILPLIVKAHFFCAVLEAMLSEQAERSIAMRSASDNAESMTKKLTRTYNRARQSQITNEMIEIISGSEGGRA
jgi:F-type H+-transporting ATPase subunit gamma